MMALLKHDFVDTEWQRLIYVSAEGADESFKWERVSSRKPRHLGNLGGLDMTVLEIKDLFALLAER